MYMDGEVLNFQLFQFRHHSPGHVQTTQRPEKGKSKKEGNSTGKNKVQWIN